MHWIVLVVLCCSKVFEEVSCEGWNYISSSSEGPANWNDTYPKCGGKKQSPINIVEADVTYNSSLKALTLSDYNRTTGLTYELTNHGHTIQVNILKDGTSDKSPIMIGHKGVTYRLAQFHFHWGSDDNRGSEHTLNKKQFPAEMHLVHFNTKYTNVSEAASKPDGLLVWGHFVKAGSNENSAFQNFVKEFPSVMDKDEKKNIPAFPISSLIPADSIGNYFTYSGSLTTPKCFESVTWLVNSKYIKVSSAQLESFRKLRSTTKTASTPAFISNNYRPTQPLNGRKVEKSFKSEPSAGIRVISSYTVVVVLVMSIVNFL